MLGAQDMAVAGIHAAIPDQNGQYSHGALIDLLFGTIRPPVAFNGPTGRDWGAAQVLRNSFLLMRYVPLELIM